MAKAQRLRLEASGIFLLAAVVGALGGFGGWAFREILRYLQALAMAPPAGKDIAAAAGFNNVVEAAGALSPLWRVLIPAAGGLLAGLLLLIVVKRPSPFGISSYMDMVQNRRSKIHPFRSLVQILSSTCSLATGGSLGREGAITQISTTFASIFGGTLKEGSRDRVVLVACGVAAGMASSYNAPIAGAIFVMEVILGSFAMEIFAPLVVSSVISTIVTKILVGPEYHPVYEADPAQIQLLFDNALIFFAILLGVFCGAGGVLFSMALDWGRKLFQMVPGSLPTRLALGGLLVGGIGIWFPQVWGNGYEAINLITTNLVKNDALNPMPMLLAILFLKLAATSFTVGSGALGGVFTPTLVVGASFGAFFAYGLDFFTGVDEHTKIAFTLVGMAGICAATTHAPITAIMLIFELTLDYNIILPVMLCSIIASLTARFLAPESYYTARLRERGFAQAAGVEELVMATNYVRDIMRADAVRVQQTESFEHVMDVFSSTRRDTIYVVDPMFTLTGRIHLHDVKYFINDPSLGSVVIAADLTRKAVTVTPDETLASILHRFDDPDLEELAVVSEGDTPTLRGRVTRRDVMACLSDEVLGKRRLRTRFRTREGREDSHVELPSATDLDKVQMPGHLVGRTIGSLDLPEGVLPLILVEKTQEGTEQRVLAQPQVAISEDSELIVMGRLEALKRLNMMLKSELPETPENS